MKYPFPATIRDLLDERMETGGYATEDDVLLRALQSLKEYDEDSLAHDPKRWPLAPEHETLPLPLRQITCGVGRRPTHRVLFAVRGQRMVVYAVRHLAQRDICPEDL